LKAISIEKREKERGEERKEEREGERRRAMRLCRDGWV